MAAVLSSLKIQALRAEVLGNGGEDVKDEREESDR
jgi:hypothetical protein